MAIDQNSRLAAIAAIKAYRDGLSTNREFDNALSDLARKSADPILRKAARALWITYDDLTGHTAVAGRGLSPSEIHLIEQWLEILAKDSGAP